MWCHAKEKRLYSGTRLEHYSECPGCLEAEQRELAKRQERGQFVALVCCEHCQGRFFAKRYSARFCSPE